MLSVCWILLAITLFGNTTAEVRRHARAARRSAWFHHETHPSAALFKRQSPMPVVGSPQWRALYPSGWGIANAATMPDAWKSAIRDLQAKGSIPNVPRSVDGKYPAGVNARSQEVCSSAHQCRADDDIWDAPDGMLGVSFDDGPTSASPALYDFLEANNQAATHFFIGENIRDNPDIFAQAFKYGGDIAVHTWSHHHMSSLSNEEIVAELGWTLQIISDLTGGRVARYWRPPFGDSDNRVRYIATNIFGLVQVDWNQDTDDWSMDRHDMQGSVANITALLTRWVNGSKTPGLIILEHELYPGAVQAFTDVYPLMKSKGWDVQPISGVVGASAYQNAASNVGAVSAMNLIPSAAPTASDVPVPTIGSVERVSTSSAAPVSVAPAASASASASTATNDAITLRGYHSLAAIGGLLGVLMIIL